MKYQQKVWRHQKRQKPNKKYSMLEQPAKQLCDKCRNHYESSKKSGHKTKCKFEKCVCPYCNLTDKRRLVMKLIQRVRRANVTARAISSDEDEDDDDASSSHPDDLRVKTIDCHLDEQQENMNKESSNECVIAGVIEQVTQAIEALPLDLSLSPSAKGSQPCKSDSFYPATCKQEFSPLGENHQLDAPVSLAHCLPTNMVQTAVPTPCSTGCLGLGHGKHATKNTSSNTFELKHTMKKEDVKYEPKYLDTVSSEQKNMDHAFVHPMFQSDNAIYLSHLSYLSSAASSLPSPLQPEDTCSALLPTFSPPTSGAFNNVLPLYSKWPKTDYTIPQVFDSYKINNVDHIGESSDPYESDISSAGRTRHMPSRGGLCHCNKPLRSYDSSSPVSFSAPFFSTKVCHESQFTEHYVRDQNGRYFDHQSLIRHSTIPLPPAASSQVQVETTTSRHDRIQPRLVQLLAPVCSVVHQNPFQSDPSLPYSPIFLPHMSRNH
ncbi:DM DNA-binding domain [Trinorchestia longiramus]|nr:DM DNA-binding domain [Trinorchestia longiramus]